jgi:hypothetical protein
MGGTVSPAGKLQSRLPEMRYIEADAAKVGAAIP